MQDDLERSVDCDSVPQAGPIHSASLQRTSESFVRALSESETQALLEAPSRGATASERITDLASMAATLLRADGCMIMLLRTKERNRTALGPYSCACPVVTQACDEWAQAGEVAGRKAVKAGHSLFIEKRSTRAGTAAATRINSAQRAIIATPIRINGDVVGVLNLISRPEAESFGAQDIAFAEIVAWFIGQALNAVSLRSVLGSAFAQRAIAEEAGHSISHAVALSSNQPQQLARTLAKSFYREMVRVGLESGQIIEAASEIISELSSNLKKHKARRQSQPGEVPNATRAPAKAA